MPDASCPRTGGALPAIAEGRSCARCGQGGPAGRLWWCGGEPPQAGVDAAATLDGPWMDDEPDTAEPPTRFPGFTVEGVLGRGGGGVVYRVRPTDGPGPPLALKVLASGAWATPGQRARFAREVEVAASLDDPGVLSVLDHGLTADGVPWFTMVEVRGPSLADLLDDPVRPPWVEVARLVSAVARTLARLHARGVRHRDIKPGNVLVTEDGRALLADFGLALPEDRTRLTRAGDALGTPAYMAPEQLEGQVEDWSRVDIYGLGRVLMALLDAPARRAGGGPPEPAPRALRWIAERAAARWSVDRYAHAGAMADDLDAWRRRQRMPWRVVVARSRVAWRFRAVRMAAAAGVALAIVGAAGAFAVRSLVTERAQDQAWEVVREEVRSADQRGDPAAAVALLEGFAAQPDIHGAAAHLAALAELADRHWAAGRPDAALTASARALELAEDEGEREAAARAIARRARATLDWDRLAGLMALDDALGWGVFPPDDPDRTAAALAFRELDTPARDPADARILARLAAGRPVPADAPTRPAVVVGDLARPLRYDPTRTHPAREDGAWVVPSDWTGWRGGGAVAEVVAWTPEGRLVALSADGAARALAEGVPPLGSVVVLQERVFAMTLGSAARVLELRGGELRPIDPALEGWSAWGLGLTTGDVDADGAADLIATLGPPDGHVVRAWRLSSDGVALLGSSRLGYLQALGVLPATAGRPPRVVLNRINAHPAPTLFGADDPNGGPCGLVLAELRAGAFVPVLEEPWRVHKPMCPHMAGLVGDLDDDGLEDLVLATREDQPPFHFATWIRRQRPDGSLHPPLQIRGVDPQALSESGGPRAVLAVRHDGDGRPERWLLGRGEQALPPLPRPRLVAQPGTCGWVLRALALPAAAAEVCEGWPAATPADRQADLSRAVVDWLTAKEPGRALETLERLEAVGLGPVGGSLRTSVWAAAARWDPAGALAGIDAEAPLPADLGAWAASVARPSAPIPLDEGLAPTVSRPLPGAVAHDSLAGALTVHVPAGAGPVLRLPLRATGEAPSLRVAGEWLRGEWAAHLDVALRPVGGGGLRLPLSVRGGSGRIARHIGPPCDLSDGPVGVAEAQAFDLHLWWGPDGESVVCRAALGERSLRVEAPAPPLPEAGAAWELVIGGAEPLLGAVGQVAVLELTRLEVGGMVVDPTARAEPPPDPWTAWAAAPSAAPPAGPLDAATIDRLAVLTRLVPDLGARLTAARGAEPAAAVLARTWAVNASVHTDEPVVRSALAALPPLPGSPLELQAWLAISKGSARATSGDLEGAAAALESALAAATHSERGAWREGLEASARLAQVALARKDPAAAREWACRAVAWAPDRDLGQRLVRNRARLADQVGAAGWGCLGVDGSSDPSSDPSDGAP